MFMAFLRQRDPRRTWRATDLSLSLLEAWFDHLVHEQMGRHGRNRKPSTARKYITTIELAWRWAANRDEYVDHVPRARRLTPDLPRQATSKVRAPSWAQMAACVNASKGWHKALTGTLYYTGLRVQQALHLREDDLDRIQGTLRVRGEHAKTVQEATGRVIPVSKHFIRFVDSWGPVYGPWLLPCDRKNRRERARDISRAWERAGVDPGVWEGAPHHCFRAGVETSLLADGHPYATVEAYLGHRLPGAGDSYVAKERLRMREMVEAWPELVFREDG